MRFRASMTVAAVVMWGSTAALADGMMERSTRKAHWCSHHTEAAHLVGLLGTDRLRAEVESRYVTAVDTFHASGATTTPRFVWAHQAKVACAKAIGYLDYPLRRTPTVEVLQKCECFFDRMAAFR